ncbi:MULTISPECIES: pentapeptide repeat-containing protein [unclassified Fusibacter]|uniref:pentapeptide repeat-containing protein n=1 Tax=unclassified Fusibacter TaxID=2624464 RepID=UPI001011EE4A|nr:MULTISPECIES: pentapeptide repeat-containing protein [unclassified Fusibacter]MCK8059130.1 pentapeptide repeat-containing protein [Fusibacter sp. A2]NPE22539.1 pentapeptide repeat-containing protein [Fusibacter sp. A1]RXV60641.1 pentapeptide repeat-containing protein [Fusibacter sp. A1]
MTTTTKRENDQINYSNRKKQKSDFVNKDLRRSNCYNSDFSCSDFSHASFRGAQFKACNFFECTFTATEFVATNLKNSRFVDAKFKNVIFDSANLTGTNFERASFDNVIFINTDFTNARNFDENAPGLRIYKTPPALEISDRLERAIRSSMNNEFIKYARVLDTKTGDINPISVMILLENFSEESLIKGLTQLKNNVDKDFGTLSFLIGLLEQYRIEGLI